MPIVRHTRAQALFLERCRRDERANRSEQRRRRDSTIPRLARRDTFYRWKKVYGSLQASEARELKQLRDEVTKLKRLVADLSLDKVMLQDVIQKKF